MRSAHVLEIVTPKKFVLNGLWFGPTKATRVIIWVHGLSSSAFSKQSMIEKLTDDQTAVLSFNNRGHDNVARIVKIKGKNGGIVAGAAYEKFEDCVDDIQGAIDFANSNGAKEIYIAGHSTGCQKAVYWASKNNLKKGEGVNGLILLAPISDYAGAVKKYGAPQLLRFVNTARAMIKNARVGELMHLKGWKDEPNSPSRFISLYTPDSTEQSVFSYFDLTRRARFLSRIKIPILIVLADKDEYADRSSHEIESWFRRVVSSAYESLIVPNTDHGFHGAESEVASAIQKWCKSGAVR